MSLSRFLLLGVWLAILLIRCWFYLLNQQLWRILRVFQNLLKPPGWVIWSVPGIKLLRILFWRNCKRFVVCLCPFHSFFIFIKLLWCFFYWVNGSSCLTKVGYTHTHTHIATALSLLLFACIAFQYMIWRIIGFLQSAIDNTGLIHCSLLKMIWSMHALF